MRMKAASIVIVIAFVITAANFGFSLVLTRQSLNETVDKDISLALNIANDLISTRISLYRSNAQTAAERLMNADDPDDPDEMEEIMREQLGSFPDFMAFTVFDRQGIVAAYGDSITSINLLNNSKYIQNAFAGRTVISTTRHNEETGKLVMHVCTPMGPDRVLCVTIPGLVFSNELARYKLWDSGNIWMIDEEGIVIAHFIPEIVDLRTNFFHTMRESNQHSTIEFFEKVLSSENGLGMYVYNDVEYHCAYAHVTTSESGWRIGLSVPLAESPAARIQNDLLLLSAMFFALSIIAAVLSSKYLAKPYDKIAEQNRRLEEFNHLTQKQADKIQEVHQRTQLMMDAMPICSMLWDKDGRIFDCNEESLNLFKMRDKEELKERFFDLSPEYQPDGQRSRDASKRCIRKAFKEGVNVFEWVHQRLDGTLIPCEITLVRVTYGDNQIVAAYARDLRKHKQMMAETLRLQTELKAALKEAQEANRAKSSFLATMSHEMRTPLNAVIGLSELILNTEVLPDETQERLSNIYISGMTLLGIVNDILDLSKIESGQFEMHPAKYDTPSLINDIVSLNIVRIGEKPITFDLNVDENMPGLLFGDDLRVKQIFNNLLSNAFKYTNSGSIKWNISFERDDNSIWLISSVEDTGIGIKRNDLRKLFRDYSQVDAQTNRKVEGTGLGLAITKRLVEMMDGTILVESEYGKGSTFTVRMRQQFVSDAAIGREMAENLMSDRFFASRRTQRLNFSHIDLSYAHVLIVDDVSTNLDVAKGMLKPYKVLVDCASSGQQAIDMIRAEKPRYNAVFMDHMMPDMDGIEATRIIREEIGTDYARKIPIIALTANAIAGNEKMFLESGFQAFISKPIDIMQLDSILRQWVRSKEHEGDSDGEKGTGPLSSENRDPDGNQPPLSSMTIQGLDIAAGLARFYHDEATYREVLESYADNTRSLLDSITGYLQTENWADYEIAVHGIKGSSYGICAMQTGKDAEHLEQLAREGETETVRALNDEFMENTARLLDSIDALISTYNRENRKPLEDSPNRELLRELREACENYDVRRVDEIMRSLESFEYRNNAQLIAWLRAQVSDMNFDEIAGDDWPSE